MGGYRFGWDTVLLPGPRWVHFHHPLPFWVYGSYVLRFLVGFMAHVSRLGCLISVLFTVQVGLPAYSFTTR